jgi:tetratricopeptide (TPR) repeat protein
LEQLALSAPDLADPFFMLGTIAFDRGKFNKAIKTYRRCLDLNPLHADAAIALSVILNDLGRYEEGKQAYLRAQAAVKAKARAVDSGSNRKLGEKQEELGDLYFQSGRFDDAREAYDRALSFDPSRRDVLLKVVDCWVEKGEIPKAISRLEEILSAQPGFLAARNRLGLLFHRQGEFERAVEAWEAVLSRDPNNTSASHYLRTVQARPGDTAWT